MRRVETSAALFRALLREISMLLAYEVTRDIPLTQRPDYHAHCADAGAGTGGQKARPGVDHAGR